MSEGIEDMNNIGTSGAEKSAAINKIKEYGKEAYKPLLNVMYKYQDEVIPYLSAISKGLQGGFDTLNQDSSSEQDKFVAQFFRKSISGLSSFQKKFESKDVSELVTFLYEKGSKHPSFMFGTSYIAGLFFGRLGRHGVTGRKNSETKPIANDLASFEQSIQ